MIDTLESIFTFNIENNALFIIAILVLLGLFAGKIIKLVKIPMVSGYIIAGIILGPSFLNILTHERLHDLELITKIALGLIVFSIGGEFEWHKIKQLGKGIWFLLAGEIVFSFVIVFALVLSFGFSVSIAFFAGLIAMPGGPSAVLMVVREYKTKGILTDYIMAAQPLNHFVALCAFAIGFGVFILLYPPQNMMHTDVNLFIPRKLIGSIILGIFVGVVMTLAEKSLKDRSELLMLVFGGTFFSIGAAEILNFDTMLTTLVAGFIIINLSFEGKAFFKVAGGMDPPVYVAFFVLAGAEFNMSYLNAIGLIGVLYFMGRFAGKYIGSFALGKFGGVPLNIRKFFGLAMLPQAGIAIGMSYLIKELYPDMGYLVLNLVLSTVIIHEILGPIAVRLALSFSGEIEDKKDLNVKGKQPEIFQRLNNDKE